MTREEPDMDAIYCLEYRLLQTNVKPKNNSNIVSLFSTSNTTIVNGYYRHNRLILRSTSVFMIFSDYNCRLHNFR